MAHVSGRARVQMTTHVGATSFSLEKETAPRSGQVARAACCPHEVWCLSMALRMVSNLCMQAVSATFLGLPAASSRS